MIARPEIDHATYQARCRRMSEAELLFTIADCRESLAAFPDCDKAGHYQDEIHYAASELERRRRGGKRQRPTADDIAAAAARAAWELAEMLDD